MAYLKPQTPLEVNGNNIYPLTTIDQIILKDGTRLGDNTGNLNITSEKIGALPNIEVTSADNGKIMTVVNGVWAAKHIYNMEEVYF